MTASDLVADLKQAADDIFDMRVSSDHLQRLLRAAAVEIQMQKERADAAEARRRPPTEPTHGRYSTYTNHRCRCEPCTAAWRDYRRAERGSALLDRGDTLRAEGSYDG